MPLPRRREAARKGIHLLALAFPLAYAAGLPQRWIVGTAGATLAVAVAVEVARRRSARVAERFAGAVGGLLRPHEGAGITGATWLALAILAAVVALPRPAALATLWCTIAGDGAAGLVGRWLGPADPPPGHKSLAGSAACAVVAVAGVHALGGYPLPAATVVALVAAAAERWGPGDDNLRLPLACGGATVALAALPA